MLTLAVDASASVATVALLEGTRVLAQGEAPMRDAKAEPLLPLVMDLLHEAHATAAEISQVVCGNGPGSFTSLRIAAATAKGFATGAQLAGAPPVQFSIVSSLVLIAAGTELPRPAGRVVAALDAMRGDRFVQLCAVDASGAVSAIEAPRRMSVADMDAYASAVEADIAGPLEGGGDWPHARGVAHLAASERRVVALASWEPDYGRLPEAQVKWEAEHGRSLSGEA